MTGSQRKILIVDDEELICWALKRSFEKHKGHTVHTARSADEALEKITENRYDIIITDWKSPSAENIEILRTARENGPTAPVIVALTSLSEDMLEKAPDYGVSRFINKPFQIEDVISAVSEAMQAQAG